MAWLREALKDGPRPAKELEANARAAGIPHTTLQHARERAYIRSQRIGNRYIWTTPAQRKQTAVAGSKALDTN
jgi:hypothetical protein